MRQIVLDTETTGLEPKQGHRIVEIGCIELLDRYVMRDHSFRCFINPDRDVPKEAFKIHGLSNEFLADKPYFVDIIDDFVAFLDGADQLIIHNAPFDLGFLHHEFALVGEQYSNIIDSIPVIDTLSMARKKHPGKKNSLDALCKRYNIDNTQRDLHGALLDAELLAEVYLAMTGGQLHIDIFGDQGQLKSGAKLKQKRAHGGLCIIPADAKELEAHCDCLAAIDKVAEGGSVWGQED